MEFLSEYGLFLAKAITVVIAILVVVGAIAAQAARNRAPGHISGHIEVRNINHVFEQFEEHLQSSILDEAEIKLLHASRKKEAKAKEKELKKQRKNGSAPSPRKRMFVLNFEGDVKASDVELLRHEISAILTVASVNDEVMVNIESPGGMVHTYGLAASQLQRIRAAGIPLTACVDKVAASGGYLMACVANKIVAAPFAVVGSIGVLAQVPNFNRVLKRFDVDYEVMTAGEHKAPITLFGEITEKGRSKLKEELEETHLLFKDFIAVHRPQVSLVEVATGEVWYGQQAIEHKLVDTILTSDDYLLQNRKETDIYEVTYVEKQTLQDRLSAAFGRGMTAVTDRLLQRNQESAVTREIS